MRAATVISLSNLVNALPRRASVTAFLCLIVAHLLWPDMVLDTPVTKPSVLEVYTLVRVSDFGG